MEHYTRAWIPNKYRGKLNITGHHDNGRVADNKPTVYMSHGAGEIITKNSELKSDYYICWTKQEYDYVISKGKKAYYTGSIYLDKTNPDVRINNTLVYAPQHTSSDYINGKCGISVCDVTKIPKQAQKPLTVEELDVLTKKHVCSSHITSLVDDSDLSLYKDHNISASNRDAHSYHIYKCKVLYCRAKVIISDFAGTFDSCAESFGINIVYRNNDRRGYEMPTDGSCESKILEALEEIYKEC